MVEQALNRTPVRQIGKIRSKRFDISFFPYLNRIKTTKQLILVMYLRYAGVVNVKYYAIFL